MREGTFFNGDPYLVTYHWKGLLTRHDNTEIYVSTSSLTYTYKLLSIVKKKKTYYFKQCITQKKLTITNFNINFLWQLRVFSL